MHAFQLCSWDQYILTSIFTLVMEWVRYKELRKSCAGGGGTNKQTVKTRWSERVKPCENISSLIQCNPPLSLIPSDFVVCGPFYTNLWSESHQSLNCWGQMTIEIFRESEHAKFHEEEFFTFCMEIKFLSNQNFGGMCLTYSSERVVWTKSGGESGRKWDGQKLGWISQWVQWGSGSTCLWVHRVSLLQSIKGYLASCQEGIWARGMIWG